MFGHGIIEGEIFSTFFQTGEEGASDYIRLASGFQPLTVVEDNEVTLSVWSNSGEGFIQIYKSGDLVGQILPMNDAHGKGLRVQARGDQIGYENLSLSALKEIYLSAGAGSYDVMVDAKKMWVYGDFYASGTLSASNKLCIERTSQGAVGLFTRESPEVKYIDEGRGSLINGECRINLDPLFLECVEPDSEETPWLIQLTPKGPFTVYEAEIGESYVIVKSHKSEVNGKFNWRISATRKGKAKTRFPRMEWLVGGDEEDDPVLTSNWEDEINER